jgi:ketosteroid isomerase-like protein
VDRLATQSLIDHLYALRNAGDLEGIVALFHPDCIFEIAGSKAKTAVAGTERGHHEVRRALANLIANFEFFERKVIRTVIEGGYAAVHSRVRLRSVPKDRTVTTDILDLCKFEDGKVVELLEFADTALINDLMQ